MSPEIVHVIEERLKRVSLSNHDHTPSPVPHLHTSTPHPSSALHESQDTPSHQTSKGYSLNLVDEYEVEDPSNVTTSSLGISLTAVQGDSSGHVTESSLLDDMRQELDEELQSIDDRLIEQMNENIRWSCTQSNLWKSTYYRGHSKWQIPTLWSIRCFMWISNKHIVSRKVCSE